MDQIIDELSRGNRIEFREFGIFELKRRKPRTARNPKTGDSVQVPEKTVVPPVVPPPPRPHGRRRRFHNSHRLLRLNNRRGRRRVHRHTRRLNACANRRCGSANV